MKGGRYMVLDQVGGTVGWDMTLEDANDLADDIDGIVVPMEMDKEEKQWSISEMQKQLKN